MGTVERLIFGGLGVLFLYAGFINHGDIYDLGLRGLMVAGIAIVGAAAFIWAVAPRCTHDEDAPRAVYP